MMVQVGNETSPIFDPSWACSVALLSDHLRLVTARRSVRQRESASMTLNPSVGQLSLLVVSSEHIFGGSFLAEHFSVAIRQGTGARSSSEGGIFLCTKAGEGAGAPAATKLNEKVIAPTASN